METTDFEYRPQYCIFITQCQRTGMRMSNTLAERLSAIEQDYGAQANDSWLADMQELGEAMLKFPGHDSLSDATTRPSITL